MIPETPAPGNRNNRGLRRCRKSREPEDDARGRTLGAVGRAVPQRGSPKPAGTGRVRADGGEVAGIPESQGPAPGPETATHRLPPAIFDSTPAVRYHGRGLAHATMPTRPPGNGKRVVDAR